jgi:hypothetical protein
MLDGEIRLVDLDPAQRGEADNTSSGRPEDGSP